MFGCGCCGRSSRDESKIKRSLEDEKDPTFGNTFQGMDPKKREANSKQHNDDILEVAKKETFKKEDMKKEIKPAPVVIELGR